MRPCRNRTQERRYAQKFEKRVKNEEYLVLLNSIITAINNTDAEQLESAFNDIYMCSTQGLSAQIRKVCANNQKRVYMISKLKPTDKTDEKIIKNAYRMLYDDFSYLRNELMKRMIS